LEGLDTPILHFAECKNFFKIG
jgi:hypothetical protein